MTEAIARNHARLLCVSPIVAYATVTDGGEKPLDGAPPGDEAEAPEDIDYGDPDESVMIMTKVSTRENLSLIHI